MPRWRRTTRRWRSWSPTTHRATTLRGGDAAALAGYPGPHSVILNRTNPRNLGIGGALQSPAVAVTRRAAVRRCRRRCSVPQRCGSVVQAWAGARRPSTSSPRRSWTSTPMATCTPASAVKPLALAQRERLGRRAPACHRRRSGVDAAAARALRPAPPDAVAEDMIMVFRAIGSGGAVTLDEPLVQYRRGGISRRVRTRAQPGRRHAS